MRSNAVVPSLCLLLVVILSFCQVTLAGLRTSPPSGAVVVRAGTTTNGEFTRITDAVNSVPNDSSSRSIFIYPGTYNEQVYITRAGPLTIYGYTTDTMSPSANNVTIQASVSASQVISDDASGTLRVHKDNFAMYNVNVKNTFGKGSQAIAISQYGNRVGLYACGFYGYQDTLLANQAQVYLRNYIEGATDFIFGQRGQAFFGGNTISVSGAGWITASGRSSDDTSSFVFDKNTIVLAPGAPSTANGKIYLGRPWGAFAKVIFKNTVINVPLNKAIWSTWNLDDPRTSNVIFADFNSSVSGLSGTTRASFSMLLSAGQVASYTIATAVGNDYVGWVDSAYLV